LVFVYVDTDNDGDTGDTGANGYLPVTLSLAGNENSGNVTVPSSGSISDGAWEFAGNPYAHKQLIGIWSHRLQLQRPVMYGMMLRLPIKAGVEVVEL